MVIGTDFKGMAQEIEASLDIPAVGAATTGLRYYNKGIYDITVELLKKFAKQKKETIVNSINIIGMTPLDFHTVGNDRDFIRLFEENGIQVLSCYYMGLTIEKIQQSVAASLNVVVSHAGLEVAQYMEKKYGIPYIAVTPIGDGADAVKRVKAALNGNLMESYKPQKGEAKTAIIGEHLISCAMRQYLQEHCGYGAIDVLSLFDVVPEQMAEDDVAVKNELELRQLLNSGKYQTVIADPLVQQLIKADDVEFYGFPHVAVSSKVHWDACKPLMAAETVEWLRGIK